MPKRIGLLTDAKQSYPRDNKPAFSLAEEVEHLSPTKDQDPRFGMIPADYGLQLVLLWLLRPLLCQCVCACCGGDDVAPLLLLRQPR